MNAAASITDAPAKSGPVTARLAKYYTAGLGLVLVDIPPGSKGPNTPRWNAPGAGYRDPEGAARHWTEHTDHGMGCLHSESNTVALDLDHTEAARVLALVGVDVGAVTEASTLVIVGNPEHPPKSFFRLPAGVLLLPRKLVWPNPEPGGRPITIFELRAGPVQDVLPPTVHPGTGKPYRGQRYPKPGKETLAELPASLLDLWQRWDELLPTMQAACPWAQPIPSARRTTGENGADWDAVRSEVLRRYSLRYALAELGVTLKGHSACCPFHDEKVPSFWVFKAEDGIERWCCAHGGAPVGVPTKSGYSVGDAIDLYAHAHGLKAGKATAELAVRFGIEGPCVRETPADERDEPEARAPGCALSVVPSSSPIVARLWPELASEAFHGLAGEIVRAIEPHSEADPAAVLIQTLVSVGNVVGNAPHFRAEADRHPLNLFAVLVGSSAKGRKGTSFGHVRNLLRSVDAAWESTRVTGGLSSGEGLIWQVRDAIYKWEKPRGTPKKPAGAAEQVLVDPGVDDKRLLLVETEFANVLKVMNREGSTLSPIVRQAWDAVAVLQALTKNSPAKATGAHISIIGHITENELRRHLTETEAGNGFGNRFLWCVVRRSKELPEGGAFHRVDIAPFVRRLGDVMSFCRTAGELRRDDEARSVWRDVYHELSAGRPGLLGAMTARAEAQVMRLACVYAVMDLSPLIRAEHLLAALAVWDYAEASAQRIFGNALGDPVADEILRALRAAPGGLTRSFILRDLFGRNQRAATVARSLALLAEQGLARSVQERDTGGRPAERWFAANMEHDRNDIDDKNPEVMSSTSSMSSPSQANAQGRV